MSTFICTIHGHLGRDPELTEHTGQNGPYKKATFSVAVSRDFGDGTDWVPCAIYGKKAEVVAKFFRKGSEILAWGRPESYTPKNDSNRKAWVLKVSGFDFCGKNENGTKTEGSEPAEYVPEGFDELAEDIPF